MSFASRWLDGLFERVGISGITGELRALLDCVLKTKSSGKQEAPWPVPVHSRTGDAGPTETPEESWRELSHEASPEEADDAQDSTNEHDTPEALASEPEEDTMASRSTQRRKGPATRKSPAPPKRAAAKKSRPAAKKAATAKKAARPTRARAAAGGAAKSEGNEAVSQLVQALRSHPRGEELISAGKQKDQLVRSLIPLYLARSAGVELEVTSGTMSRFWGELGVTYAAPNAAKALRLHTGYAQDTKKGKAITNKGVTYVEKALNKARGAGAR